MRELDGSVDVGSDSPSLTKLKEELWRECRKIAEKYRFDLAHGNPKLSTILAIIASSPNLCCVAEGLRIRRREYIDPYYLSRHNIAVNLIVENLYERLTALQYSASVGAEVPINFGKLDILLEPNLHGVELCYSQQKIAVEVKTGLSLDLTQMFRYLLDVDVLILVRLQSKQVVPLRRIELLGPLSALLGAWTSRARRLLVSEVPVCTHKRSAAQLQFLDSEALTSDITTFARNLNIILNPLTDAVLWELRRIQRHSVEVNPHE